MLSITCYSPSVRPPICLLHCTLHLKCLHVWWRSLQKPKAPSFQIGSGWNFAYTLTESKLISYRRLTISLLQHVNIACYAERCISYDRFRLSVRLSHWTLQLKRRVSTFNHYWHNACREPKLLLTTNRKSMISNFYKFKFSQNFALNKLKVLFNGVLYGRWYEEYKLAFTLIVAAEETVEPTPSTSRTSSNEHQFGMLSIDLSRFA